MRGDLPSSLPSSLLPRMQRRSLVHVVGCRSERNEEGVNHHHHRRRRRRRRHNQQEQQTLDAEKRAFCQHDWSVKKRRQSLAESPRNTVPRLETNACRSDGRLLGVRKAILGTKAAFCRRVGHNNNGTKRRNFS